ncbi:hypothetical protein JRQ81_008759, partial [Phrynocephalus forsythii]
RDSWCEGTRETKALLCKCRQLVRHFSHSIKAARMLSEKQVDLGQAEEFPPTHQVELHLRNGEMPGGAEGCIMSTTPIVGRGRELDIGATEWLAQSQM